VSKSDQSRIRLETADRRVKWRVMVELTGSDGTVRAHEVSTGGGDTAECSAATVGLTLADGKRTLAGLKRRASVRRTTWSTGSILRCVSSMLPGGQELARRIGSDVGSHSSLAGNLDYATAKRR
jgi:hypothetical protein